MISHKSKYLLIVVVVLILVGCIYLYRKVHVRQVPQQVVTIDDKTYQQISKQPAKSGGVASEPASVVSYSLKIPFTPQAPTGNWDELHNEACEEASALMANAYFLGDTREVIPAAEVEKQITSLTNWQQQHFGYTLDTTAQETAQMIQSVYNLKATVVKDFTESDIKNDITAGSVVIIPVNGQVIGNPYYKQPGPIYHMLVIRGFTKDTLITNDSGTKHGENYTYSFTTLKNAAANWDHSTNTIDQTKKVMIVVSK